MRHKLIVLAFTMSLSSYACVDLSGEYELRNCTDNENKSKQNILLADIDEDKRLEKYAKFKIEQSGCKVVKVSFKTRYYEDVKLLLLSGKNTEKSPYSTFVRNKVEVNLGKNFLSLRKTDGSLFFKNKREIQIKKIKTGLSINGQYKYRGFDTGTQSWTQNCYAEKLN